MGLELKIIGSNSAAFAHFRHHTSQLLKIQDHHFLIDCGEGTQLLLKKNRVKISRIDAVLISHLHGDHYFGLIGLLSTMHLFGRERNLYVAGPPGLAEIITLQLKYSETALSYPIVFTEWKPEEIELVFEHDKFTVETIPMDHRIPCSGFLFREKPKKRRINRAILEEVELNHLEISRLKNGEDILNNDGSVKYENKKMTLDPSPPFSYAFCSDTRYRPEVISQIKDVNLLYHESTFAEDMKERAEATYHSTATQAADIAKKANVDRLILGHFSTRYRELDIILDEAKSVFPNSFLAIEGKKFEVNEGK